MEQVRLTRREMEVFEALTLGLSNPEIADRLFMSVKTVCFHLRNIYSKLGVHTRAKAVLCRYRVHV